MICSVLRLARPALARRQGTKNIFIIRLASNQVSSASQFINTESPFKNDGSLFKKFRRAIGLGEANVVALRRTSVFHYEACTDKLNPLDFFKHLQLPDTVFSFFLVVQLHVWMCQTRSMREGPEGRRLRNEIGERMWQDWDNRLKKVEILAFEQRKSILNDLLFHHQGAMLSYDEGLLTDDKTLAGALWRTLFMKNPVEPETLEMAVKYVRTQMVHLRSISPRDWCLDGDFEWAPFPPLYVKTSPILGSQFNSKSTQTLNSPLDNKSFEYKNPPTDNKPTKTSSSPSDNKSSKTGNLPLKKFSESVDIKKFEPPDENIDLPKKHVFQQLKQKRLTTSVYTLEEAAVPCNPDSKNRYWRYPTLANQLGNFEYALRSYENQHTTVFQFPDLTDFVVVGAGLVGSATAYYTKKTTNRCADVIVIDKSPYTTHSCTAICNGLISSQSKSQDVSRISTLSKELIRALKNDVLVTKEDFAKINYRPCTHLILWPENEVEEVMNSVEVQIEDGCYTETKLPDELEATWPWLKVQGTDVALGTHGNQDEALVDPIALRNLYRTLAQAHGVHFIQAEAIDFNTMHHRLMECITPISVGALVARISSGELKQVCYAKALLALGHNTPFLEARAELEDFMRESIEDLHFLQPKLRLCFSFSSMDTPVINFPVITDTDGSTLIRDDLAGSFKYYSTLNESDKFIEEDCEQFMDLTSDDPFVNLIHKSEMFEKHFNNVIKPRLVNRIPLMDDAKFLFATSGFENYNTHDGNPLMSIHPYHQKLLLSGGYGNRMMSFGPAAAAAFAELFIYDEERLFDVTNFYWNRMLAGRTMHEFPSLLG